MIMDDLFAIIVFLVFLLFYFLIWVATDREKGELVCNFKHRQKAYNFFLKTEIFQICFYFCSKYSLALRKNLFETVLSATNHLRENVEDYFILENFKLILMLML